MNISTQDMETIRGTADRFGASAVYRFGSSLASEGEPRDIDLAVKGCPRASSSSSTGCCSVPSRVRWMW